MDWDALISIALHILARGGAGVAQRVLCGGGVRAGEGAGHATESADAARAIGARRWRDYILQRLDAFLSAAQLGITLASLGLGWIGEPVFAVLLRAGVRLAAASNRRKCASRWRSSSASRPSPSCTSAPGSRRPNGWRFRSRWRRRSGSPIPLLWFYRASYPFVWLLNWASQWLLRQVGHRTGQRGGAGAFRGGVAPAVGRRAEASRAARALGRDIVLNALDLRRRVVREVMRPRQEIVRAGHRSQHRRVPGCGGEDALLALSAVRRRATWTRRWAWFTSRTCTPCGSRRGAGRTCCRRRAS